MHTSDNRYSVTFLKVVMFLILISLLLKQYFLKYNPIRKYTKKKLILLTAKKFLYCGTNRFSNKAKVSVIFTGNLVMIEILH